MRVLIITTKRQWYDNIHALSSIEEIKCPSVNSVVESSGRGFSTIFGSHEVLPFRRQLLDDSYLYVMLCIGGGYSPTTGKKVKDLLDLTKRQEFIGALAQDVIKDLKSHGKISQEQELELLVVAHDDDLFNEESNCDRFFDIDQDINVAQNLKDIKGGVKKLIIYGYQHKDSSNMRVFRIIKHKLIKETQNCDVFEEFRQIIEDIE